MSIEQEVGSFSVKEVAVTRAEVGAGTLTATEIHTDIGRTLHADGDGSETEAKLDLADLSERPRLRRRLPTEYRNVPRETDVQLIGQESSVVLVRTPTDNERRKLSRAVGKDADTFEAVYQSDIDGFVVTPTNTDGGVRQYRVDRPISASSVQKMGEVTTQSCTATCLTCASAAASKGICYGSCYLAATLAGAVLCAACVVTSSVGLISCGQCCDCAGC